MPANKPNVGVKTTGSDPAKASNTLSYIEVNSLVDTVTQHSVEIDAKAATSDLNAAVLVLNTAISNKVASSELTNAVNNIIDSVEFDDSATGFFVVTVENGVKKITLDIDKLKVALGTTGGSTGGSGGSGTPYSR